MSAQGITGAEVPDILIRDAAGETISINDPDYQIISDIIENAQRIVAKLNTGYHPPEEVRAIMSELTGVQIDESVGILPPFYTDLGRNIRIGKRVFINSCCTLMDRGGITIGDDCLLAPKVNLVTIAHPLDPATRRSTVSRPIVLGRNVWIGAAATVLPGVTIGDNSVVGANSVVTKDVPPNTVVAGIPARVIRQI